MRILFNFFESIVQGQYFQSISLGVIGASLFIIFYPVILAKFRIGFIHYFLDYAMAFYAIAGFKHNNHKVYKKYQKRRYVFRSRVNVDLKKPIPKNEPPKSATLASKSAGFLRLSFKTKFAETLTERFACFDERYYVKPTVVKSDLEGESSASRFLGYDIRGRTKEVEPDPFRQLYEHIGYTKAEPIFIKG
ncbi:MAG: hypothetical protein OQJ89_10500, partial [Kangiellaceae bacterium]|nr:hypothetical protein [Kangiellaceae bacterium]